MKPTITTLFLAALLVGTAQAQGVSEVQGQTKEAKTKKKKAKPKYFKIGKKVDPNLALKDTNGKVHKLGDYKGKIVFIQFWSYLCPWITITQPRLNAIHNDYKKKGVVVLGINPDYREVGVEPPVIEQGNGDEEAPLPFAKVRAFMKDKKVTYPMLADHSGKVAKLFRARTTPHCFVIDRKGILRYTGGLDNDPRGRKKDSIPYVREAIEDLLDGEEVAITSSKPYG